MKIFKILSIMILFSFGLFFTSCEKDDMVDGLDSSKTEVSFDINHVMGLKSDAFDIECTGGEAVTAEIMIDGFNEPFTPSLLDVNNEVMTQVIKLNSGSYTVTSFKLLDVDGNVVQATPTEGSEYEIYVSETVPFELVVPEFDKVEKEVDVLCFNESEYTNFGFNWFNVGQVEVNEIFFFGDLCYDPLVYEGSLYDDLFNLEDYPFDIPALFEIRTFVDNDGEWESLKTFSNVVDNQYVEGPVSAEWFTHSNGVVDFKFELWVLVYTGQGLFEYVKFDEFEFDSENPLTAETNNVVDFVIGDCFYEGTPPQFNYPVPPVIEPTPGPIVEEGTLCKEKLAQARWRNFRTNNNGWDMAVGAPVHDDNTVFSELDWTSGYLLDGTPMPVTLEYDGNDLTITVDIDGTIKTATHTVGSLTDGDLMEIMVRGSVNQTVQLDKPELNNVLLTGVDTPQTGSTAFWTVLAFDFGEPWTLTGNLIIQGEATSQEGAKVDISIGSEVPCEEQ
ncbi:MAG: hypothetical protein ACOC2W_04740 [bacterium]